MSMEKPLPEKEQIITLLCTYANIDQPFQQVLEEHMKHNARNLADRDDADNEEPRRPSWEKCADGIWQPEPSITVQ